MLKIFQLLSSKLNNLLETYKILFIYRSGKAIGEIFYLTSYVRKINEMDKNYKIILLINYPEIFDFNDKIFFKKKFPKNTFIKQLFIFFLKKINGKNIINFNPRYISKNEDEHFLINYPKSYHMANTLGNLEIIDKNLKVENEFFFSKQEELNLSKKLKLPKVYALIHSESKNTFSKLKNWGHENMQEIVYSLDSTFWIQIGKSGEVKLKDLEYRFDLSIREIAYVVKNCKFLVSNEGLFNHVASCFKKKNFMILSGMIPKEAIAYDNNISFLKVSDLECYPCYKLNNCIIGNKPCISRTSSKEVIKRIKHEFPELK